MSDPNFSGRREEFTVGEVYGVRGFIPENGFLTAFTNDYVYSSGENIAGCVKRKTTQRSRIEVIQAYKLGIISSPEYERQLQELASGQHDLYDCTCGFYAYYTDGQHRNQETIEGIIKAYGKVTMGPLGFRAQKAEVVALCLGVRVPDAENPRISFKAAGIKRPGFEQGMLLTVIAIYIALICMLPGIGARITPSIGLLIFTPMFIATCWRPRKYCRLKRVDLHRPFCKCTPYNDRNKKSYSAEYAASVAKNYPNAEIFETYDDMKKAYHDRLVQSHRTAVAKIPKKDRHGDSLE